MLKTLAAIGAIFVATPALAAPTTLTASGRITSVTALQNGNTVATPSGVIRVGDVYTLSATFDFTTAQLTSLYDADPTINIYNLPGTTVSYTISSFSQTFRPVYDFNASIQIWNDRVVVSSPVDSQSFDFFNYTPASLPFDLGAGQQSISLDVNAFDNTATARTNDLISQIAPFTAFASKSFSFGQLNSNTNLFVSVQGDVASETLSPVPEPTTWAMMTLGMGAVGYWARRCRTTVVARTRRQTAVS